MRAKQFSSLKNNVFFFLTGSGQFGSVAKGECTLRNGVVVPVAVKTLKNEDIGAKEEVFKCHPNALSLNC